MTMTVEAQAAMRTRVKAAADEVEQLDEALSIARQRRDGLIVEALEEGASQRDVSRWAGMSQSRIGAILAEH